MYIPIIKYNLLEKLLKHRIVIDHVSDHFVPTEWSEICHVKHIERIILATPSRLLTIIGFSQVEEVCRVIFHVSSRVHIIDTIGGIIFSERPKDIL